MLQEFLRPARLRSPSGRTEIVQARFIDALCIYNAMNAIVGPIASDAELHQARRKNGLYIRPTLGFESFGAILPWMFALSPAIRLSRNWDKPGSLPPFNDLDLLSIRDCEADRIIGFTTIERQKNPADVEFTLYVEPASRNTEHAPAAAWLTLNRAQQIFDSENVVVVSGRTGARQLYERVGFTHIREDSAEDKRGTRHVMKARIAPLRHKLRDRFTALHHARQNRAG